MSRMPWPEYFMKIAHLVAERSTCLRRKVGAVAVRDKRILATGYNGAPSGLPHCMETGCLRDEMNVPSGERTELCRGLHAEMNALLQGARHGVRVEGGTVYTTLAPCSLCSKMIINSGIVRVVAGVDYPETFGREMLEAAGVELVTLRDGGGDTAPGEGD